MITREAYVFGWVYGHVCSLNHSLKADPGMAAMRPYSGLAEIISAARRADLLTDEADAEISMALREIKSISPPMEGNSEKVQPLEIQGSWQLGYFGGLSGAPLPPGDLDIAARRRARNMTQAELAQAMGTDQAVISRWERGVIAPNENNLAKLHAILD